MSTDARSERLLSAMRAAVPQAYSAHLELDPALPRADLRAFETVLLSTPLDVLADPVRTLREIRLTMSASATLWFCVANASGAEGLVQLLRSDPHQESYSEPRARHRHGYATTYKIALEAGFSPELVTAVEDGPDEALMEAARPVLEHLRVDAHRAQRHLGAVGYVFAARPVTELPVADAGDSATVPPLTFVACVNDEAQLLNNLAASPVFGKGSPHELLLYRGMSSAAEGLNRGIREASHDLVVLIQQDIYVPSWWPQRLHDQWRQASLVAAPPALGGPFGVLYREGGREHVGHAIDRDRLLRLPRELPADVDGLDELVLVVPRDTPLRFTAALGWHLYGTDMSLQAHRDGLRVVVLDAPVHHNSLLATLDQSYRHSEAVLAGRWPAELPIMTNSSVIDTDPRDLRISGLEALVEQTRGIVESLTAELATERHRAEEAVRRAQRLRQKLRAARERPRE